MQLVRFDPTQEIPVVDAVIFGPRRSEADGLLGFDVIKKLHLEMDGPKGMLRFFSASDRNIVEKAIDLSRKHPEALDKQDTRILLELACL